MNDRFKFRAWNKETKKMHNVIELDLRKAHICWNFLDSKEFEDFTYTSNFNESVLMQSTGLKDKNGVLIYEEDILQDSLGNIYEISFIKYCYYIHEIKRHHWAKLDEGYISYEVIGNIYENPELLEVNNADILHKQSNK